MTKVNRHQTAHRSRLPTYIHTYMIEISYYSHIDACMDSTKTWQFFATGYFGEQDAQNELLKDKYYVSRFCTSLQDCLG